MGVNHFYGLKFAIIASTVFSISEISLKYFRSTKVTPLFKFSAAITLIFGCVDLYAQQSFLFKHESVATNVITGVFFASSLFGGKTVIQEYYEASRQPQADDSRSCCVLQVSDERLGS